MPPRAAGEAPVRDDGDRFAPSSLAFKGARRASISGMHGGHFGPRSSDSTLQVAGDDPAPMIAGMADGSSSRPRPGLVNHGTLSTVNLATPPRATRLPFRIAEVAVRVQSARRSTGSRPGRARAPKAALAASRRWSFAANGDAVAVEQSGVEQSFITCGMPHGARCRSNGQVLARRLEVAQHGNFCRIALEVRRSSIRLQSAVRDSEKCSTAFQSTRPSP
jgi:hypothetical protein